MDARRSTLLRRTRRHNRVRARIHGTAARPRLAVVRSTAHLHAQLIDDVVGRTLVAVYERELTPADRKKTKTERSVALGTLLAQKAKTKGIAAVVLDRGSARYHGRVAAFANAVRKGGITL